MYAITPDRHMKRHAKKNKKLYRWLMINGKGSFETGVMAYAEAMNHAKDKISAIYFNLTGKREFSKFYEESGCSKLYKNYRSFITAVSNIISTNHEKRMRFDSYCMLKRIIKIYHEWRTGIA